MAQKVAFSHLWMCRKGSFYQDRLGTNTGKALKKTAVFLLLADRTAYLLAAMQFFGVLSTALGTLYQVWKTHIFCDAILY
jgi:hypothetical protein